MRGLGLLVCGALSTFCVGCSTYVCDAKTGETACAYCGQDRLATGNPHAGTCRYCPGSTNCSGDSCTDALQCESKVFLAIPGATFHQGTPPTIGKGAVPAVTSVTASSSTLSMGATIQWTIHWHVTGSVTGLLFEVPELGGYYDLPLTTDAANLGAVTFPMSETATAPTAADCLGSTQCWQEALASIKTSGATAALVAPDGTVGQSLAGDAVSWTAPASPQSTSSGSGSGCPGSAAALGCCTTSGGIQKIGVYVVAPCGCPGDTCGQAGGYCGCPACGGC